MLKNWHKRVIVIVFLLMTSKLAIADQEFKVTGIMMGSQPVAIINGQTVGKGDQVDGAEVIIITNDSVTLKYQGNLIVSQIIEGGSSAQEVPNNQQAAADSGQTDINNDLSEVNKEVESEMAADLILEGHDENSYAKASLYRYKKIPQKYYLEIQNLTNTPITLNYYGDEYAFWSKDNKAYSIPTASIDVESYPEVINPGRKGTVYFVFVDLSAEEIAYMGAVIDGGQIKIVLQPVPLK